MGLNFGRHAPLQHCSSFRVRQVDSFSSISFFLRLMQSILRFLWDKAAIGSTKFSTTNGVDYYASLFAFELVAFSMCV
jgi:hypothetical protein